MRDLFEKEEMIYLIVIVFFEKKTFNHFDSARALMFK
jgi:hypothetical protein